MQKSLEELPFMDQLVANTTALAIGGGVLLVFLFVWCRIFSKAGYHAALGLLMLVPVVNLFLVAMLGFARWPIERELRSYRQVQRAVHKTDRDQMRRVA